MGLEIAGFETHHLEQAHPELTFRLPNKENLDNQFPAPNVVAGTSFL